MPDVFGYPTKEELQRVQEWPYRDKVGLLNFVHSLWHLPEWGWTRKLRRDHLIVELSTGGWSGNESLITALERNDLFWFSCWKVSRFGGHHVFDLGKVNAEGKD